MSTGSTYGKYLGIELRRARQLRGWSRGEMVDRVRVTTGVALSRQALASYEQGTRSCTMVRLRQLCTALAVDMATVLSGMERMVRRERHRDSPYVVDCLIVDLDRLAVAVPARLAPVRAWARTMLATGRFRTVDGHRTWQLAADTLAPLATLCAVPPGRLTLLLGRYLCHPGAPARRGPHRR